MPCYHPTEVPVFRKNKYAIRRQMDLVVVPCGRCIGCRAEQTRQWAVRMMHESRMFVHNAFVTLTYNDKELPENVELRAAHLSGFIKSLRKTQSGARLSFFGCGEYGEKNGRPHYHALLFNTRFLDKCADPLSVGGGVWRSESLDSIWGRGRTEGGTVTMASASYVAGYIRKKIRQKDYVRANPLTGELKTPEFARMSLRPAIGRRWIEQYWRDVYPRDYVVVDGVEAKPPRYYDKWMDAVHETSPRCNFGKACPEHMDTMERVRLRRYEEAIELTPYQLCAGEKIHRARINLFAGRDRV